MQDFPNAQLGPFAVEVKDLFKSFRGKTALENVTMSAKHGEMLALVGASGSGKSTLLRNINGLHQADRGTVCIFGNTLQSEGKYHSHVRRLRSQIGFIFQQFNLVNRLTALENVLAGNLASVSLTRSLLRNFSRVEKIKALSALERVEILEHSYKRASMLSGIYAGSHEANALAVAENQVDVATNNNENLDRLKETAPDALEKIQIIHVFYPAWLLSCLSRPQQHPTPT
ncbi:MAG: ATP-binding cassette domain-containing protein [Leptolyngbyaceae cyanobacterium MO_188.B28]|nr:ATP-binding cassette domain-containing protein [Leptolyngbyaceae cyanobacterium MO_188.B28]